MMKRFVFAAIALTLVAGCQGPKIASADLTVTSSPALPVTLAPSSISIPVGIAAVLQVHPKESDGTAFPDEWDMTVDDSNVLGAERMKKTSVGEQQTNFLIFASTIGTTTLRVKPVPTLDSGEADITVLVGDQAP